MKKTNSKGQPLTCKFCHSEVWLDENDRRYYDVGGETLHVENCDLRKQFFKNRAAENAENRRQGR